MPAKNVRKIFVADKTYHIYNRGVEKRRIFLDERDYRTFLFYLKYYLSPNNADIKQDGKGSTFVMKTRTGSRIRSKRNDLSDLIDLLAFALMPNHFHLLIKQKTKDAMTKFMRRLGTAYSTYFNERYNRVGSLFQGTYKAVEVERPREILYVSYYIHRNVGVEGFGKGSTFAHRGHRFTSLPHYLGLKQAPWIKPQIVLKHLSEIVPPVSSYQKFIDSQLEDLEETVKGKTLE